MGQPAGTGADAANRAMACRHTRQQLHGRRQRWVGRRRQPPGDDEQAGQWVRFLCRHRAEQRGDGIRREVGAAVGNDRDAVGGLAEYMIGRLKRFDRAGQGQRRKRIVQDESENLRRMRHRTGRPT